MAEVAKWESYHTDLCARRYITMLNEPEVACDCGLSEAVEAAIEAAVESERDRSDDAHA